MAPEAQHRDAGLAEADMRGVLHEYMAVADRLQQTHEALQGEVVRLRRELASKDRELELRRRLAALGELAAGVAHEVRNPLGAIQLYSGLLRRECDKRQLAPALELIEKIDAGIQAIDGVVKDTLALAPRDRALRPCLLRTVIEHARDACLDTLTRRRVRLEVHCEDPHTHVLADEAGLQRVLINLFVNGAEASPAGGTVCVQVAAPSGREVELRVNDQGAGLPEETAHRVFDPFFTTKEHGTGLGLTIAHRLIEAYGGRLTAGNRPTGGAEFVLALPVGETSGALDGHAVAAREFNVA